MAGITENGDLRRIYPVPFDKFREIDFHKRHWIEYNRLEKGDYRKESYKIDPDSVEIREKIPYKQIGRMLEERVTTIDTLNDWQDEDDTSLGFVKPDPTELRVEVDADRAQRAKQYDEQTTLTGGDMPVKVIPHKLTYQFRCGETCETEHNIMCEDIEIGMLYWKLRERHDSIETVEQKLEEKFVDWMMKTRDLYFMMGTHFSWGSWLIVSVLYPEQIKSTSLDQFG